jgi:hypothetical protein
MNDKRAHHRPRSLLLWGALIGVVGCGGDGCRSAGDGGDGLGACENGLLPGDLVITEIMADPPGADSGREWFEIYNASALELDLRGVVLLHSRQDGTDAKVHPVARSWAISPDDYAVAGAVIDDEEVLAVVPYVDYGYADVLGDMRNSGGRLVVACGEEVIDEALYAEPTQGASRGFTGDRTPDASGNDDLALWCDAQTAVDAESLGTPGDRNDFCVGSGPVSCVEAGTIREAVAPPLGDLVVTEIMSDPEATEDDLGEWFEIRTNADFDLNGLMVGRASDLSDAEVVTGEACVPVKAGTILVIAKSEDPESNGGLPRVDALFDFNLNQSNNQVVVSYGGQILDALAYGSTQAGTAHNLDPRYQTPELNDDPRYLCRATLPYGAGDLGTPGEDNTQCEIPAPEGQCLDDDGSFRDIIAPQPGDLAVTELMANPEAAAEESESEWFEVQAAATFDLNGVALGTVEGEPRELLETTACARLAAGDHAVIAREADPALNGGLPQVDATFGFALTNSDGALWIGTDAATLDLVTWPSVPAGAARSVDPSAANPQANDDDAAWCPAIEPYGDGDLGTPGADNPSCGTIATGTCLDGGARRDVVVPQPGDLVITEWMPDSFEVTDAEGEWFELLATADVDLNGLQLANDPRLADDALPVGGDCLAVAAGERVVLARQADPTLNGGLPPVLGTFGFGLTNSDAALYVGMGGEVLDGVTWTSSTPGAAWTVDPAAEDPLGNDDPANVCLATDPFGGGDLGTPGTQGPACGGMTSDGMCLDGGVPRAIVFPGAGDLVITEWMPNPSGVTDANGEWFELYASADIDLNDLQLSRATDVAGPFTVETTLGSPGCLAVPAGSYVVFARNLDPLVNGELPVADFVFAFSLNNSNAGLAIGVADVHIDEVTWMSSSDGAATQIDAIGTTCDAVDLYGPVANDNHGTPGAANPACP